jgi:glycosyltransferase involved in cell wall biosynthesis
MVAAVESAPDWSLDIVGPVSATDRDRLERYRAEGPARDRLRLHGRMPPRSAWELARGAWCGLVLLEDTAAFRAAMPSKLYEYAACGLPVVVSDLPRQREFVQTHELGVVVPAGPQGGLEAGRALTDLLENPSTAQAMRSNAARWRSGAQEWRAAYEQAAAEVRSLV